MFDQLKKNDGCLLIIVVYVGIQKNQLIAHSSIVEMQGVWVWILLSFVKDLLKGWHKSFTNKIERKSRKQLIFCCFEQFDKNETKDSNKCSKTSPM